MEKQTSSLALAKAMKEFLGSLQSIRSPHTLTWYTLMLTSLCEFLGDDLPVAQIKSRDLRRWRSTRAQRKERWDKHPTRPRRAPRKSVVCWLEDAGWIAANPARRFELPPLPDEPPIRISRADLEKMVRVARGQSRDYGLVLFLADTGARVGGAAGLHWKDVALSKGRAVVREIGCGDKRQSRTDHLGTRTRHALKRLCQQKDEGPVFAR